MRNLLSIIFSLLGCLTMCAAPVSHEQAREQARQFLALRGHVLQEQAVSLARRQPRRMQAMDAAYYVFNADDAQGGFVIVGGDDRMPAILGYADSGSFDSDEMPDNLSAWLQEYADQLEWLSQQAEAPLRTPRKVLRSSIAPMLTTTWDQNDPYNRQCPPFLSTGTQCITGCVATAMAQVMYYHQWPQSPCAAIPAYDCATNWGGGTARFMSTRSPPPPSAGETCCLPMPAARVRATPRRAQLSPRSWPIAVLP